MEEFGGVMYSSAEVLLLLLLTRKGDESLVFIPKDPDRGLSISICISREEFTVGYDPDPFAATGVKISFEEVKAERVAGLWASRVPLRVLGYPPKCLEGV